MKSAASGAVGTVTSDELRVAILQCLDLPGEARIKLVRIGDAAIIDLPNE